VQALGHLSRPADELAACLKERIDGATRYPYVYAYPPKGAYRPLGDERAVVDSWRDYVGDLGLYVHVPFCDMKCSFCTLFTTIKQPQDRISRYAECLSRELAIVLGDTGQRTARSVYFGGGTPTVLRIDEIERVLTTAGRRLHISPDAEISIESTPDAVDREALVRLRALGFNRISFGVQSFAPEELQSMGRRYDPGLSLTAPRSAIDLGFPNVNIDLIFGIPGQRLTDWIANLERAVQLGVSTITVYPLVVRDRTKFARLHHRSPDDFLTEEERERWYAETVDRLAAAGYRQHSEVTFARSGGGCRHEANEFLGLPTLGIGAGARSYAPALHYTNDDYGRDISAHAIIDDYLQDVSAGRASVRMAVSLDRGEQRLRYVMLSLLHQGVDADAYRNRFGEGVSVDFGQWFEALTRCGLAVWTDGRLELTTTGRTHSAMIGHSMFSDSIRQMSGGYR
jgi:oxygen-independent coproporphyrinogen III oxidase